MPKTKTKRKSRSCNRGYPCGGSCISRGYNCRKKLTGQANNYANWLKLQGDRLGDDFNKEAGSRLSKQVNSRLKVNQPTTIKDGLKGLLSMVDKLESAALKSDKNMLKVQEILLKSAEKTISNAKKNPNKYKTDSFWVEQLKLAKADKTMAQKEIKGLKQSIAKREKRLNKNAVKNQIKGFKKLTDKEKEILNLDREFVDLKTERSRNIARKLSELDRLKNQLNDIGEKANQIVPFKKRTKEFKELDAIGGDSASLPLLNNQYKLIKKQFDGAIADLNTEINDLIKYAHFALLKLA